MTTKRKVILLTGATGGMGQAIAKRFVAAGGEFKDCNIVLADLPGTEQAAEKLAKDIHAQTPRYSGAMEFVPLDVTNPAMVGEAVAQVIEEFGVIDVLINNAGIMPLELIGALVRLDEETIEELGHTVMEVNFWGPLRLCKRVLPHMRKAGYGRIINMSSIATIGGEERNHVYAASKRALEALTCSLAAGEAQAVPHEPTEAFDITVNAVAPGIADTEMTQYLDGEKPKAFMGRYYARSPRHRKIRPEAVASEVVYLSREESSAINGQVRVVDDGYTISR